MSVELDTQPHIFKKAAFGDVSILDDPKVSIVRDDFGDTPLHDLAMCFKFEVLTHKDVSTVKNRLGYTPLHELAYQVGNRLSSTNKELTDSVKEKTLEIKSKMYNHPDFNKVTDICGDTPKNVFEKWIRSSYHAN